MMKTENKINICFMSDSAIETFRTNIEEVTKFLKENPNDTNWIKKIYNSEDIFIEKKYKINDFELDTSYDGNYVKVDYNNSIKLYENLKVLPRYILTDERFWAWFNFTIGYKASLQAMPIKSSSTFKDHWLFSGGQRRGLFFGVMSRCFFRVELTVDERREDKYELTKFVIENPERFRNLTWRANSSQKHLVLGILKAEKEIYEKYGKKVKNNIYADVAKFVSLYGSVRLIDAISEEEIYKAVYDYMEKWINKKED